MSELLLPYIVQDIKALHGSWEEFQKPLDQVILVLARLGLSAIKRRIVARSHCRMDLLLQETFLPEEREDPVSPRTAAASSTSSPSTRAPSPLSKSFSESLIRTKWSQKQYFPMGVSGEAVFIADGFTEQTLTDPEKSEWRTTAIWEDGVLIQHRYSEKLMITMFDSRCVVNKRFKLTPSDVTAIDEESSIEETLQYFQWRVIDHRDNDAELFCHFYLTRIE